MKYTWCALIRTCSLQAHIVGLVSGISCAWVYAHIELMAAVTVHSLGVPSWSSRSVLGSRGDPLVRWVLCGVHIGWVEGHVGGVRGGASWRGWGWGLVNTTTSTTTTTTTFLEKIISDRDTI